MTSLLHSHLYGEAGKAIREFVWSELCDWYIEAAKVRLRGTAEEQAAVAQTLAYALERSLKLLHPFTPFVTETLWAEVPHVGDGLIVAAWPTAGVRDAAAEESFGALVETVRAIRNARTEAGVEPGKWIAATVHAGRHAAAFEAARRELASLARIDESQLEIRADAPGAGQGMLTAVAGDVVALLPLAGMLDMGAERERLEKELGEARLERERAEKQLGNEAFVSRAPEAVIEVQRKRLQTALEQIALLERRIADLG